MRGPRLENLADIASFQATLIRRLYTGKLDPKRAGVLTYMLNSLRATLERSDLERRIEQLEQAQTGAGTLKVAP